MIAYMATHESTTRRMLESILAVEEEHAEDLSTLLASFKEKGEEPGQGGKGSKDRHSKTKESKKKSSKNKDKPSKRDVMPDAIFPTEEAKFDAVVATTQQMLRSGRPPPCPMPWS